MSKRAAQGAGTIRKKTVMRKGKPYIYWEARITTGRDPGTGKQVQQSFTGKTQKEVREKLQAAAVSVNAGTYIKPEKMTVGQWLDTWTKEYLSGVKPTTQGIYKRNVKNHIKPALGAVKLSALRPHMIQAFVNGLALAPASVHLAFKVLHQALEKAVCLGYLPANPAARCELPRIEREEIHPLDDSQVLALLKAAQGSDLEYLIQTALFTGCRLSELLGLTWDCVGRDTLTINKQLARPNQRESGPFITTKNGKPRTIAPAGAVMAALHKQRNAQAAARFKAGPLWENPYGFVFTDGTGEPLSQWYVDKHFSKLLSAAGITGARFHDLRHPYVKHTTKIFSLRLMDFQAQAYPDARRKTRGACQLHRGGQSRSPVRPLCNRKQLSCLLPQSKMSWILYAISMRLSGYTSTRSISSSASSVVSVSASKIALDASLRLSCRACSSCFCFACANTAAWAFFVFSSSSSHAAFSAL